MELCGPCRNIYAESCSEEADRRVLSADPDQFLDLFALFLVEGSIEAVFVVVARVSGGYEGCGPIPFFFFNETGPCILSFFKIERNLVGIFKLFLLKMLFFTGG